jgi:alkane 1-monooxygenase
MPFRYWLPNVLIAGFAAALLLENAWLWLALVLSLVLGGALDEALGDDRSIVSAEWRWLCETSLYATLPLLLVMTFGFLHVIAAGQSTFLMVGATMGCGYFYALAGVTVGHELTHRTTNRFAMMTGRALMAFTLSPTFAIAHVYGHHRNVCTHQDPATARRGESALAFAFRSSAGQVIEAFALEAQRLRRRGLHQWSWHNRAVTSQLYSIVLVTLAAWMAGVAGVIAFVAAALIGKLFHELVNYVQHYGLVRIDGGAIEARHAWDCYRTLSNALQYNLPRHAHHHLAATRPYWSLEPTPGAPVLPHGYQTCALIALIPFLWRSRIDPLLARWDREAASTEEYELIGKLGWCRADRQEQAIPGQRVPLDQG